MPVASYSPTKQTLGQILSSTSPPIRVPDFQRDFSWQSKQASDLWDDLHRFDTQFPGNLVEGKEYFLGSAVLVNTGTHHLVLDGQQRLATATILLSAIRDKIRPVNTNASEQIQRDYIVVEDHLAGGARQCKLELNVFDRSFFRAHIQDVPRTPMPATKRSHRLIVGARRLFDQKLNEIWCIHPQQSAIAKLSRLATLLTKHFGLVVVTSTDQDHAASIFETLNDRGIGLSTADLLRSWLLTESPEAAREEMIRLWTEIFRSAKKEKPEVVIRASWVSRQGDVKARSMYKEIKDKLRSDHTQPVQFTRDLHADALAYQSLVRAATGDAVIDEVCRGLANLKAAGCFATLIAAKHRGDEILSPVGKAIAALTVRHNVVCRRDPTKLEAKAFEAAHLLSSGRSLDEVVQCLRQLSPTAQDFAASFETLAFTPRRHKVVQILLRTIENHRVNTGEKIIASPKKVNVEHVYPQSPAPDDRWRSHDEFVYRLGNLTLLSAPLNQQQQNVPFCQKKDNYNQSTFDITREMCQLGEWTPERINERQRRLATEAANIWPVLLL